MNKIVRVEIDPDFRQVAMNMMYDVEPFDAELIGGGHSMFWHCVRPLSGKHAAEIDLPPMFKITVLWAMKAGTP